MATYDINKLRQMYTLGGDITGGGIMGGGGGPMMYEEEQTAPMLPRQQQAPQPEYRMPAPIPFGQPQSQPQDSSGIWEMINQRYTPSTRASDRFNNLLDAFPEREEPSWARRLVAGGMGLGSKTPIEDMEKVMYAPYIRDVAAWKEKTGPFQQGAALENTANINERTLMGNVISADVQGRKIEEAQRKAEAAQLETNRKNLANEEIQRQRNAIARAKANGAKFHTKGDRIIAMFPDGTTVDAGPSGNFSPFEIEELKQTGRVEIEGMRQTGATERTALGGWVPVQDDQGNRFEWNPRTNQTRPATGTTARSPEGPVTRVGGGGSGSQGLNPNEVKQDRLNRIQAALDSNPAWEEFYDEETGKFIEPTAGIFSGVSAAKKMEYDRFRKTIDPNYKSTYNQGTGPGLQSGGTEYVPNSQGEYSSGYTSNRSSGAQGPTGTTGAVKTPEDLTNQPIIIVKDNKTYIQIVDERGKPVGYIEDTPAERQKLQNTNFQIRIR